SDWRIFAYPLGPDAAVYVSRRSAAGYEGFRQNRLSRNKDRAVRRRTARGSEKLCSQTGHDSSASFGRADCSDRRHRGNERKSGLYRWQTFGRCRFLISIRHGTNRRHSAHPTDAWATGSEKRNASETNRARRGGWIG